MANQPQMPRSLPVVDDFDPANQALADALRKSFVLLKWVMGLVLVLYLSSGLFRVKTGEVGYVMRMGEVVERDLGPGWHWSWPFPIEEARTMSNFGERSVTVSFMFLLTEQQKLRGVQSGTPTQLRPGRDFYLVTGDMNILHAELTAQYIIPIGETYEYLRHTLDVTPDDKNPPEYELISQMLAASASEVAAERSVDDVYKDRNGFQSAVCARLNEHLAALGRQELSLGLSVKRVIATQFEGLEAITPPLSVRAEFEAVTNAEQKKGQTISEARGSAEELLSRIAGPEHDALAAAIDAEFTAQREGGAQLGELREHTEKLLIAGSGEVRGILKRAESARDRLANEAAGDASKVRSLAAEFKQNPGFLMSRMRQSLWQRMLASPMINRQYVPTAAHEVRLQVPRDPVQQEKALKARAEIEKERAAANPPPPPQEPIKLQRLGP